MISLPQYPQSYPQSCMLSLAFQSIYQILLWFFQGILSGTTSTILSFHNFPIPLFISWYFATFLFLILLLLHQMISWYSNIDDYPLSLFLSVTIMSCLLASITLSHWTLISNNTFTSSFSTTPSVFIALFRMF